MKGHCGTRLIGFKMLRIGWAFANMDTHAHWSAGDAMRPPPPPPPPPPLVTVLLLLPFVFPSREYKFICASNGEAVSQSARLTGRKTRHLCPRMEAPRNVCSFPHSIKMVGTQIYPRVCFKIQDNDMGQHLARLPSINRIVFLCMGVWVCIAVSVCVCVCGGVRYMVYVVGGQLRKIENRW